MSVTVPCVNLTLFFSSTRSEAVRCESFPFIHNHKYLAWSHIAQGSYSPFPVSKLRLLNLLSNYVAWLSLITMRNRITLLEENMRKSIKLCTHCKRKKIVIMWRIRGDGCQAFYGLVGWRYGCLEIVSRKPFTIFSFGVNALNGDSKSIRTLRL